LTSNRTLAGTTVLMSGGSRGIGLAIAVRVAHAGANVAFIAKTATPDPRLPGTIHTAAAAIEAAGGHVLPVQGDIRDIETVAGAVDATVDRFGFIDADVLRAAGRDDLTGYAARPGTPDSGLWADLFVEHVGPTGPRPQ
jgi:citronellol/citronellal dehydrogenase